MPELPDVETFRRYLGSTALHKKIEDVDVSRPGLLKDVSKRKLEGALQGRRLESAERHGKYLGIDVGDTGWLVLHFGMTGRLDYHKGDSPRHDHTRLALHLDNGYELDYVAQRAIGSIRLVDDFEEFAREQRLGPDARGIGLDEFRAALEGKRGSVKAALMDQKKIAGIGNDYSDEVLFQARMHPATGVGELDSDDWRNLHRSLGYVLDAAIDAKADASEMPSTFLLPHRKKGGECPGCGGGVASAKIAGRTAYFCPVCQGD